MFGCHSSVSHAIDANGNRRLTEAGHTLVMSFLNYDDRGNSVKGRELD